MSKRLTKLSRAKPNKKAIVEEKVQHDLDSSAEDFQKTTDIKLKPKEVENNLNTQNSATIISSIVSQPNVSCDSSISSAAVPPCPFCGKSFKVEQELARLAHLKSCGTQLGLGVDQLLEVRKLEEKQAEQWKALNLPRATNVSKNRTNNSSRTKTSIIKSQFQMTGDPQLDMALALSASMASESETITKSPSKKCWLPQPPPGPMKKSKAKTALQVRNDQDRTKQIEESVMHILSTDPNVEFSTDKFSEFMLKNDSLKCLRSYDNNLWKAARTLANQNVNYKVDVFMKYETVNFPKNKTKIQLKGPQINNKKDELSKDEVENVGHDWETLLESGDRADITIYARNEFELKAHSLVLFVRCKEALNEIIEENQSKRILSWANVSKNVAKSFLKYIYSGKLEIELESPQDYEDAQCLCKNYPKLKTWVTFITNIKCPDNGGFFDSEQEDEEEINDNADELQGPTQNLDQLLELLDDEEEEDKEWTEMCQFLSQSQKSPTSNSNKSSESPEEESTLFKSIKRKSSIELNEELNKRSKIDEFEEEFTPGPDATVYKRRLSSPNIDLTGFNENTEPEEESEMSSILDSSIPELTQKQTTNKKKSKIDFSDHQSITTTNAKSSKFEISPSSSRMNHLNFKSPKSVSGSNMDYSPIKSEKMSDVEESPIKSTFHSPLKNKLFKSFSTPSFLKSPKQSSDSDTNQSPVKKIRNSPIFHHETRKSFSFADLDGGEESPSKPIVNSSPIKNLVKLTPMPDYEEMLSPALRQELRRYYILQCVKPRGSVFAA